MKFLKSREKKKERKKKILRPSKVGGKVTHEGIGIRNKPASTRKLETRKQQISAFTIMRENYFLPRDPGEGHFHICLKKVLSYLVIFR